MYLGKGTLSWAVRNYSPVFILTKVQQTNVCFNKFI